MNEQLKQTLAALEKALTDAEGKSATLEAELANPFLKSELRGKYKKTVGAYGDLKKKLKTQIRGLKMLVNISPDELQKLKNNQMKPS